MRHIPRRTAMLIRHRDRLRVVPVGPWQNGLYEAWLIWPDDSPLVGGIIARSGPIYPTPEAAVVEFAAHVLAIARSGAARGA